MARVGGQTQEQSARDLYEIMRFSCVIRARRINIAAVAATFSCFINPRHIVSDPDSYCLFANSENYPRIAKLYQRYFQCIEKHTLFFQSITSTQSKIYAISNMYDSLISFQLTLLLINIDTFKYVIKMKRLNNHCCSQSIARPIIADILWRRYEIMSSLNLREHSRELLNHLFHLSDCSQLHRHNETRESLVPIFFSMIAWFWSAGDK